MDLSRISTNIQSQQAYGALQKTNSELGMRQLRLATGSKINRAEDDSAGYTISNKLEAKVRGQAQALSNIGDAKSMLTVGEGALNSVMDILQTMKEKATQAANDTLGADERTAIQSQLDALATEVSDVLGADFNGTALFGGGSGQNGALALSFQVGDKAADAFAVSINAMSAASLGLEATTNTVDAAAAASGTDAAIVENAAFAGASDASASYRIVDNAGSMELHKDDGAGNFSVVGSYTGLDASGSAISITDGDFTFEIAEGTTLAGGEEFVIAGTAEVTTSTGGLNVSDAAGSGSAITTLDTAIQTVNAAVSALGDSQSRLSIKADNLQTSMTNYDAARSRISDADFAKEQMQIVKMQILQQTGTAGLSQANAGPQSVLQLLR